MLKTQGIADLAIMLSAVTTTDRARAAIQRALSSTGLTRAQTLSETDVQRLLTALAAQGGVIEEIATQIAIHGIGDGSGLGIATRIPDPTDRSAA
ncbi:MAG: hypothetical protein FJZ92_09265 [Chloroflexi bacterium]|nr:hypothetical protein [Chloroflexota bacterium]